jgi:protein-S-isoprenylcysteine O-methyltransferase Ste14
VVAALGLALAFAGVAAVIRHRTTIVPHHPVATLLTGGVYRLSRNPMYTGLAIAYLGLALLLGSWWPLALWPLVIVAVRQLVIRPEEQYLTQRFGQTYTDYQSRVRRWL